MERRTFLRVSVLGASTAAFTGSLWGQAFAAPAQPGPSPYGSLRAADSNGIQLPNGFTSRVIAQSRQAVSGTSYAWHDAPDGGACFTDGAGWIYVSNSEITGTGGASAVRFNSSGTVTSAYRILANTNRNCAGGRRRGTPGCPARKWIPATSTRPTRLGAPPCAALRWAGSITRLPQPTQFAR